MWVLLDCGLSTRSTGGHGSINATRRRDFEFDIAKASKYSSKMVVSFLLLR